jgi:hypothetical protein
LQKPFTKEGLVEWLKVQALSSNPSTGKKNNKMDLFGFCHRLNVYVLTLRNSHVKIFIHNVIELELGPLGGD